MDAVYVGPSDLSLALGCKPRLDQTDAPVVEAQQMIAEACKRHGVVAGIHNAHRRLRAQDDRRGLPVRHARQRQPLHGRQGRRGSRRRPQDAAPRAGSSRRTRCRCASTARCWSGRARIWPPSSGGPHAAEGRGRRGGRGPACPTTRGARCFLLTKRAPTLRAHTGQWALPGGRIDAGREPPRGGAPRAARGSGARARRRGRCSACSTTTRRARASSSRPSCFWADDPGALVAEPRRGGARAICVPLDDLDASRTCRASSAFPRATGR